MTDILDDDFILWTRMVLFVANLMLIIVPICKGFELYWGLLGFTAWGVVFTNLSIYFSMYAKKERDTFD